jgi:hypothetical protein
MHFYHELAEAKDRPLGPGSRTSLTVEAMSIVQRCEFLYHNLLLVRTSDTTPALHHTHAQSQVPVQNDLPASCGARE